MKRIAWDKLSLQSRIVWEKHLLTGDVCQKIGIAAGILLLRLGKEASDKNSNFLGWKLFSTSIEENQCNSRHPYWLASIRCGKKCADELVIKGDSVELGKSVSLQIACRSLPTSTTCCFTRIRCPWLSATYLDGYYVFNRMVSSFKLSFPFWVPGSQNCCVLVKCCLVVVFASVTDKKGLGQSACPKEWKKYEGGMDSNINVM